MAAPRWGIVKLEESEYAVVTRDGWELVVTRFQAEAQTGALPLSGEPLLLIHGFSQNRLAWTIGRFVSTLAEAGIDVHLGELRGHGKSSIERQRDRHRSLGSPLPADLDHGWELDAYLLEDLPALIEGVKRAAGQERIFYGGHSLGGILGYAYAGNHDDLDGLITLGAAVEPGRDWLPFRLVSRFEPQIAKGLDSTLSLLESARRLGRASTPSGETQPLRYRYLPMDAFLQGYGWLMAAEGRHELYGRLCAQVNALVVLSNPGKVVRDEVQSLLELGGEKEPRRVAAQLAGWVRTGRVVCERAGVDIRASLSKIRVPTLVLYGEADKLANRKGTEAVVREIASDYRRWIGVPGNGHLELTMGLDVGSICGHIQELMLHVRSGRARLQ